MTPTTPGEVLLLILVPAIVGALIGIWLNDRYF